MRRGRVEIRLDGAQWLSRIAGWGGLSWSERLDGGCWEASWSLEGASKAFDHHLVRRGAFVEIFVGPGCVWCGVLSEPDRDAWEMHATGLSRQAETALALDGSGTATSNPVTAIDNGVALNGWSGHRGFTSADFASPPELNYVSALLGAVAESEGKHWGVGPDGIAYLRAADTEPSYRMAPGVGELGIADDDFYTWLVGRYRSGASTLATAEAYDSAAGVRWGFRQRAVDLTGRGIMTGPAAEAALQGMLDQVGARPGWTTGLDADRWQMTTIGGTPVFTPWVRPGQMIRLHGVRGAGLEPRTYQDIVIGEVRHTAESDTIYIEPLGMVARNLDAVLEEAVG